MRPATSEETTQNEFNQDRCTDGERSLLIAFKDAERKLSGEQDAGDKKWSKETVVEIEPRPPPLLRRFNRRLCRTDWDAKFRHLCRLLHLVKFSDFRAFQRLHFT